MPRATSLSLDAYGLEDGSRQRGIGVYIQHLVQGLSARDDIELSVIGGLATDVPDGASRVGVRAVMPTRWRAAERRWRLSGAIRRSGTSLFHSTGQVPPRHSPIPWVQTLQDVTPLYFPHSLMADEARRWKALGEVLQRAAAVITPSRSSADQGVRYLGLDPRRVHTVPYGVGAEFSPTGPPSPVTGDFLLWVSTWGPHKGLDEALDATAVLRAKGYPHRLVVAGHIEPFAKQLVTESIHAKDLDGSVELIGRVDDLAALYRAATALVVSSRAEGFGFPPLEAMACGTPVVSFDNTSLPEVVGDAGLLVPDGDAAAMAGALQDVIDDAGTAKDLSRAGVARAATYTWERSIDAHVAVYREAGLAS